MENTSLNITEIISNTINELFESLFSSIDDNIYSVLDDITFIDINILDDLYFRDLFGTDLSNGILLIANSCILGFILYYACRYFLSNFTYMEIESPYQFLFKIIISTIFMNFSFFICEQFISFNSILSSLVRNVGETTLNKNICFYELIEYINNQVSFYNNFNIFSMDGLLKGFSSIGLLNLIFSYSFRYILIKVLILISPFCFLFLSIHSLSWIFKSWLKSFLTLLFLEVFISFILLIIFSLDFNSSNLLTKLICFGSIYTLIKANSFLKELFGGISTDVQLNLGNFKSFIK